MVADLAAATAEVDAAGDYVVGVSVDEAEAPEFGAVALGHFYAAWPIGE